jgi:acylphosphatase
VRNLPDRRVEAVLQGERTAVESVIDSMRTGPPGSAVIDCVVSWCPAGERFHGFDIRY